MPKHTKAPEEGSGEAGEGRRERENEGLKGGTRENIKAPEERMSIEGRHCFSLQRSVMSIEGRLVQEQHSSGVQCGGCLKAPEDSQETHIRRGKRDCFSLQRSVMSIEGRLVQEQHSSGVQCGGCLNQDTRIKGFAGFKTGGIFNARTNGPRRKTESVGVGSPNPSGGGTPPLRLRTYRSPAIRSCL